MAKIELVPQAVIFDLDGVLVDSRAAVDATWTEWSARHGLEPQLVLRTIPGMRTRDAVTLLAPGSDVGAEALRIVEREQSRVDLVTAIPGAAALVAQLAGGRWGIATSGIESIARSRLIAAGLPVPDVFITADTVARGKPDPEVYERAAAALNVEAQSCVVFEDAPSGIAAATAAGATVIGVLTWAERDLLATPYAVRDLLGVNATRSGSRVELAFWNEP